MRFSYGAISSLLTAKKALIVLFSVTNPEHLSFAMIQEAEALAVEKWAPIRGYTYINSRKIKSSNPGYCFPMRRLEKGGINHVEKSDNHGKGAL